MALARLEFRCRVQLACNRDRNTIRDVFERELARTPITGWDPEMMRAQMHIGLSSSCAEGNLYFLGAKLGYTGEEQQKRRRVLRLLKHAKRYGRPKPTTLLLRG